MRVVLGAVVACAVLAGSVPASAQMSSREGIALQNEILELRHQLQILEYQYQRGAPPPMPEAYGQPPGGAESGGGLVPQLLDRVSRLEEEVRRLRGQVEENQNALQQQQQDFSKQLSDLQFRLQNGAPSGAPTGTPAPGVLPLGRPTVNPAPPPRVRRTPELALQEGHAALARRDYATAEADAREVLAAGRTSPRAAEAQMLLAQALAGKRDYRGAAVAYGDAAERLRGSPRGQDALIGLANSLNALNAHQAACGALEQLRTSYKSLRPDIRKAAAAARARAGCR